VGKSDPPRGKQEDRPDKSKGKKCSWRDIPNSEMEREMFSLTTEQEREANEEERGVHAITYGMHYGLL